MPCPLVQGQEHTKVFLLLCVVSNFKPSLFIPTASPSPPKRLLQGAGTAEKRKSGDSYPQVRSPQVLEKRSSQETGHQGCQGNLKY